MPDLAHEVFGDVGDAVAALNNNASGGDTSGSEANNETETQPQDVDSQSQGTDDKSEKSPATSGEKTDESKTADSKDSAEQGKQPKPKVDGAAKIREWGEGWEKTAKQHETKLAEVKPILDLVEEKFGGTEALTIASEMYEALTAEDFDAADALEWLEETTPKAAEALVQYIGKELVQKATDTALSRTFGRNLSEADISAITDFLAAGKKANYDSFFKSDEVPEDMQFDEDGNKLPEATLDYMRRQNQLIRQANEKTSALEQRMNAGDAEAANAKAAQAIETYAGEQWAAIDKTISRLGLDKPVEGETAEVREMREYHADVLNGLAMYFASKDKPFQAIYKKALNSVAEAAASPKNRVAKADAVDYSRRLQAKIEGFANKAADFLSPLLEQTAKTRTAQVGKVNEAKGDLETPGSEAPAQSSFNSDDPFDKAAIAAQVSDMTRAGKFKSR